jgi:hypothetical protein
LRTAFCITIANDRASPRKPSEASRVQGNSTPSGKLQTRNPMIVKTFRSPYRFSRFRLFCLPDGSAFRQVPGHPRHPNEHLRRLPPSRLNEASCPMWLSSPRASHLFNLPYPVSRLYGSRLLRPWARACQQYQSQPHYVLCTMEHRVELGVVRGRYGDLPARFAIGRDTVLGWRKRLGWPRRTIK